MIKAPPWLTVDVDQACTCLQPRKLVQGLYQQPMHTENGWYTQAEFNNEKANACVTSTKVKS